jgi:hypothetical protein
MVMSWLLFLKKQEMPWSGLADYGEAGCGFWMTEYQTFAGETIRRGSIVEAIVRLRSQHMGWGIVEALYPEHRYSVPTAMVRDLNGMVLKIDLPFLRLHHEYGHVNLLEEQ